MLLYRDRKEPSEVKNAPVCMARPERRALRRHSRPYQAATQRSQLAHRMRMGRSSKLTRAEAIAHLSDEYILRVYSVLGSYSSRVPTDSSHGSGRTIARRQLDACTKTRLLHACSHSAACKPSACGGALLIVDKDYASGVGSCCRRAYFNLT